MGEPSAHILVVEDDSTTRLAYRQALEACGYTVDAASTVAQGMAKVRASFYDLLVVDYALDDGTGIDVVREARDAWDDHIPQFVVITAVTNDAIVDETVREGAIVCLLKEGGIRQMVRAVRTAVSRAQVMHRLLMKQSQAQRVGAAIGILAVQLGCSTQKAEQELRRRARRQRRPMVDIARELIHAQDLIAGADVGSAPAGGTSTHTGRRHHGASRESDG